MIDNWALRHIVSNGPLVIKCECYANCLVCIASKELNVIYQARKTLFERSSEHRKER